ncbi:MBL fold metallo-hydrolase [Frankia sp. AgB32]|uniref:MBL fold metallo-hydrolase n=1 Tax=Frankia sp. AgB32 TaxID=631119 RepID=UPI00200E86E7|nr:MBL fold metallo-hydrolase [Frankia sp. AgB32]MCK9898435.1 MBL fold metallo-hydrolase [Frankia sp. AgB32]
MDRYSWAEPVVEEVHPGIHRIPLPLPNDGLRAVNVYAIEQPGGLVLVDAGWSVPESERQLEMLLGQLGAGLGDVKRFLVTHVHRDHYTQAVALRRRFGATIALGRGEQPALERLLNTGALPAREHRARGLRQLGAAALADELEQRIQDNPDSPGVWEMPDEWIDGEVDVPLATTTLRALPTPGHTPGHVVFHDPAERLLFAGDHVLPTITPSIGLTTDPGPLPLGAFLTSLRMVRTMPDARLLPAHGPVTDSVHARVDELLEHHAERLDAAVAAVTAGADTAYQVARALPWTRRARPFDDLDVFNRMLATSETAAHLDLLVAQGRLREQRIDDVIHVAEA